MHIQLIPGATETKGPLGRVRTLTTEHVCTTGAALGWVWVVPTHDTIGACNECRVEHETVLTIVIAVPRLLLALTLARVGLHASPPHRRFLFCDVVWTTIEVVASYRIWMSELFPSHSQFRRRNHRHCRCGSSSDFWIARSDSRSSSALGIQRISLL